MTVRLFVITQLASTVHYSLSVQLSVSHSYFFICRRILQPNSLAYTQRKLLDLLHCWHCRTRNCSQRWNRVRIF